MTFWNKIKEFFTGKKEESVQDTTIKFTEEELAKARELVDRNFHNDYYKQASKKIGGARYNARRASDNKPVNKTEDDMINTSITNPMNPMSPLYQDSSRSYSSESCDSGRSYHNDSYSSSSSSNDSSSSSSSSGGGCD